MYLALNRKLRPRIRVLPEAPPPTVDNQPKTSRRPTLPEPPVSIDEQFASVMEEKIDHLGEEIDEKEREQFLAARKNLLDELDGIFRQGFTETLAHSDEEKKLSNVDYSEIKRQNYAKAVGDYEAAGKTLADSGLFSNAAISYGCMILGKFLATNSLSEMYDEFQNIIEQIQDKQIIRSSFFSLLTQLFEAIAIKDTKGIMRQLERLKLIETFSTDDQQLIADAIEGISGLFSR